MPRRIKGKLTAHDRIYWYLRKGVSSKEFQVTLFDGVRVQHHHFSGETAAVQFARANGAKKPVVLQAASALR